MTDNKIIPHPRHYWGVYDNKDGLLFDGTFNECWNHLITNYQQYTVAMLERDGICIKRIK